MAVQRQRLLLAPLLLLLLAGAVTLAGAAQDEAAPPPPKARPPKPPRSPKPPKPPKAAKSPPPPDAGPESPPAEPAPAPTLAPSPSPSPEPMASPPAAAALESPPPPAMPPPPPEILKLILQITGGPLELSPEQEQSVVAVLSRYSTPYNYTFRAQRPAAPGISPVLNTKTAVPSFSPVPSPPPAESPTQQQARAGNTDGGGPGNGNGGDNNNNNNGNGGNGRHNKRQQQQQQQQGDNRRRRSLRRQLLRFGAVAAGSTLHRASVSRGLLEATCPGDKQFVVASQAECTAECEKKVTGKQDAHVYPEVFTSGSGTALCCNCRYRQGVEQAGASEAPSYTRATEDGGGTWWPTDILPTPLNADGVYVFADCAVPASGVETIKLNLLTVSNDGALCKELGSSGVSCDTTAIRFHDTGAVVASAEAGADGSANTSSSSDGLSTGAIVGIVVGGCAGLAAIIVAISMFVSCRRERAINNAAKQRTMSRRADPALEPESKWRQMYSARMQESMRRTEEATARQAAASSGPSFLEMQDRQFSQQAASPQRSFSSKKSFGRGTPASETGLGRESPDHSLMTGSELSSPPPSVNTKPSRSRSLKKLFGGGGGKI